VVEAFTQTAATSVAQPEAIPNDGATPTSKRSEVTESNLTAEPPAVRRGPGRPRSKRRMEPFSSKLDIELRDAIDAYLFEHGGTLVDLLDEALRARIER
jgi:hypothetical protein